MPRRIMAVAIICYSLFSILLMSHHSKNGEVFARYSTGYFIFLLFYYIGLILLIISYFNTHRIRVIIQKAGRRLADFSVFYFVEKHFNKLLPAVFIWFCLGVFYLFE